MKILHVLSTGGYSGAENVVITLINSMKEISECVYTSPNGDIATILSENGIKYYPMKTSPINIIELKKIITECKPDIIHAHDFLASAVAALVSGRIPIISHLHNNPLWGKKICIWTIAYFCLSKKYKRILSVSDAVMDEFVFGKYLQVKTRTVGNPIDVKGIRHKADMAKIKEKSDVIFLGRLTKAKDPIFFLEIIKDLVKMIPSVKVAIVGDGELRDNVMEKCKEFGLENNIKLYGFVRNPYGLLKNSKVLCMPSQWEGFGLAAVEALVFGRPVLAAPVGGLTNIITSECGELCTSREEYVSEMKKLLFDQLYYENKSRNAKIRAKSYDNIVEYTRKVMSEYNKLI